MFKKHLIALCLLAAGGNVHASISTIGLGDFVNPVILNFQSTPLGSISGSDSLFTDVGIASVTPTPESTDTDTYDSRTNSTRALGANSSGLQIFDPGTAGAADTNFWSLSLTNDVFRFGFSTHDTNNLALDIQFFDGVTSVGSASPTPSSSDRNDFFFESTVAFDRITIDQPNTAAGFGFMLDNITLEQRASVPEPATLALMGLGLLGVAGVARRRKMAA